MAVPTYTLHSWETRAYPVTVFTDTDPTGDTLEVGVVASTETDLDPGSWTTGSWDAGSFANGQATGLTPSFGTSESSPSPDIELTEGLEYHVMLRVRSGTLAPGAPIMYLKVE